jgi:heptosyltransferase-2
VTLLAKPYAQDLQRRLWPGVQVVPFVAPWTAFKRKYRLWRWPWLHMLRLWRQLAGERFAVGLSARWDPRDHFGLRLFRAGKRLGFPRLGSAVWLTHPLARPEPRAHRYEYWRVLGEALGVPLPARERILFPPPRARGGILVHSGAGQSVRVWPLERYDRLVRRLRAAGYRVEVACDPDQRERWLQLGEAGVATPHAVTELVGLVDRASAFLGNDSGPGHLAAFCGVPTFTLFGPQVPEWFVPLHPRAQWLEGKACPYKPCSDYCRFATPRCMAEIGEEEVTGHVLEFLRCVSPPTTRAGRAAART